MITGRPRNFSACPDCKQPIRSSHSPYYKCSCRGYILRSGKLEPTRARQVGRVKLRRVVEERLPMTWQEYEELAG